MHAIGAETRKPAAILETQLETSWKLLPFSLRSRGNHNGNSKETSGFREEQEFFPLATLSRVIA